MTRSRNLAERFLWTFVAAGIGALPVTLALTPSALSVAGWAALTAAIAAVISLAKNLVLSPPPFSPNATWNILERLAWTAVQAFVGSLPATITLTGHNLAAVGYSGLTAAVAALVSFAKGLSFVVAPTPLPAPAPPSAPASPPAA